MFCTQITSWQEKNYQRVKELLGIRAGRQEMMQVLCMYKILWRHMWVLFSVFLAWQSFPTLKISTPARSKRLPERRKSQSSNRRMANTMDRATWRIDLSDAEGIVPPVSWHHNNINIYIADGQLLGICMIPRIKVLSLFNISAIFEFKHERWWHMHKQFAF